MVIDSNIEKCIHGIPLNLFCIECDEYMRNYTKQYDPDAELPYREVQ